MARAGKQKVARRAGRGKSVGVLSVELRQFFDTMAAHFPGHVMQRVMERDGRVRYTYASPGLTALGLDPSAIVADRESAQSWIHPDDAARWRAALIASSQTLDTLDEEVRVIGQDGRVRWVRSIGNPRRWRNGAVIWDGIALDVTEKREALDALRLSKAHAEAAEAAKARLVAGVATALEQPLRELIAGLSEPAARLDRTVAARLTKSVERIKDIVETLQQRPAELATILPRSPEDERFAALTARQRTVLALIAEGKSNRELGEALGISEGTAKVHVATVLKALGASNRTAAALIFHGRKT